MTGTRSSPWRLVVVDMDGTLVSATTALAHLQTWIGHPSHIEDLEAELAHGRLSDREVADAYATSYAGIAEVDARDAMRSIPHIDDVAEGVALLRQRSVPACIATVSWSFAASSLADLWGFDAAYGAELEVDAVTGRFTGRVARHFAPQDKVEVVAERCRRTGIELEQVVAIGDSRSDVPLFEAVGFSVAFERHPRCPGRGQHGRGFGVLRAGAASGSWPHHVMRVAATRPVYSKVVCSSTTTFSAARRWSPRPQGLTPALRW